MRAYHILFALTASAVAAEPATNVAWPPITAQCRPGGYWWWMGSAVDRENLTREMERYHAAGMGGVHIIPIYGAVGYEDEYIDYLSPQWMEMLRHVVNEGRRLDMFVDMTTGTGWCFGGPGVSDADACVLVDIKADSKSVSQKKARCKVKRAAPGGAGPMLNPFAVDSMPHYLERFTRAFDAYEGPLPRAMYHDSYEYNSNWSLDVLGEFQKRRGYRLQDELPALAGKGDEDHVARVKCDYRETLSDIMIERFIPPWTEWSRQHGFITRYQAHGSPGNLLDLYALADVPETEMFSKDRSTFISKFASSAAHVAGRKLTSAETGTWLKEHFTETLGDVKDLVDQMFLAGVNHVFYHGTCYSPDEAPWPGWVFYASTEMNPRNSIWYDVPTLNAYIARCQAVLQAGEPDNDVLVYWPVYDLWHDPSGMVRQFTVHDRTWLRGTPCGDVSEWLWKVGISFDYVSDRQIAVAKCEKRNYGIVVPGGTYQAIVVPPCDHMPVETLEHLAALARNGGNILFVNKLPVDVPGPGMLETRRKTLKEQIAAIRARNEVSLRESRPHDYVFIGRLDPVIFALVHGREEEFAGNPGLQFIRRKLGDDHFYFFNNRGEQPIDDWVPLAAEAESIALLDPMTGHVGLAKSRESGGRIQFYLQLPPGGSMIVEASPTRLSAPDWAYWRNRCQPLNLTAHWQVTFLHGGPTPPPEFKTDKLASWTELDGPTAEAFAGTARYRTVFDSPGKAGAWLLDLGRVCQSARVSLNGKPVGALIQAPFQVLLPELKPQGNVLEIEVTNVSANRIRDLDRRGIRWKTFHDANVLSPTYKPLDASHWPLTDSGLLGPVKLIGQERLKP